jgi:hypothetical protein
MNFLQRTKSGSMVRRVKRLTPAPNPKVLDALSLLMKFWQVVRLNPELVQAVERHPVGSMQNLATKWAQIEGRPVKDGSQFDRIIELAQQAKADFVNSTVMRDVVLMEKAFEIEVTTSQEANKQKSRKSDAVARERKKMCAKVYDNYLQGEITRNELINIARRFYPPNKSEAYIVKNFNEYARKAKKDLGES